MKLVNRNKQSNLPRAIVAASLSLAVAGTCLAMPSGAFAASSTDKASSQSSATVKTDNGKAAQAEEDKAPSSYLKGRYFTVSPEDLLKDFTDELGLYEDFGYEVKDTSYESVSCYEILEGDARVGRLYFGTWEESVAPADMGTEGIDLNMTLALDRVNVNADAHTANAFSSLIMACDPTLTSDDALEIAQEAYEQGWSVRNGLKYIYVIDDEYVWLKMEVYHGAEPKWIIWYDKAPTVYHNLSIEVSPEVDFNFSEDYFIDTINNDIIYRLDFVSEYDKSTASSGTWKKLSEADATLMETILTLDGYTAFGTEQISNRNLDVFVGYFYSDSDPSWYAMSLLVRSEDHAWIFAIHATSVTGDDQGIIDVVRQLGNGIAIGDLKGDKGSLLA